jgi:hypothetical protein
VPNNESTTIAGDLSINTGLENDLVDISQLFVGGNTEIETGHGRDLVEFYIVNEFYGDVSINTGVHNDVVHASGSNTIHGNLLIQMGQGDDSVLGCRFRGIPGPEITVLGAALLVGGQGFDILGTPSQLIVDNGMLDIVGFESQ